MQPDSLVFALVVGLWAAYLLPQWVRRRESLGQSRTRDRHSQRLRVLSRRRSSRSVTGPSSRPLLLGTAVGAGSAAFGTPPVRAGARANARPLPAVPVVSAGPDAEEGDLPQAPAGFVHTPSRFKEHPDLRYTLQISLEDCTGCGLCGAESLQQAVRKPEPVTGAQCIPHAAIERALRELLAAAGTLVPPPIPRRQPGRHRPGGRPDVRRAPCPGP